MAQVVERILGKDEVSSSNLLSSSSKSTPKIRGAFACFYRENHSEKENGEDG